jgi:RNA polymerase sigma-70 factor, ECF subfamily
MNGNKPISLTGLKRKDIKAFEVLFFKYHGRLVLFANKFTGDLRVSQDLVQDAFLKLWEKPQSISTIESPKAYLFQAVRNNCLNHHRHLNIKYSVEKKLVAKIDSLEKATYFDYKDPLHSLLELEIDDKVDKIVQSMPEKCRQIFKMSRRDFLKNKEIAKKLGISVKMVEKHISKALVLLRTGLSEYMTALLLLLLNKF